MIREYLIKVITNKTKDPLSIIIRPILLLLSIFYLLLVKMRVLFYDLGIFRSIRLKRPVISVGNITWGGTGKTPMSESISLSFKSQHKKVALLTRGYGNDEDRILTQKLKGVAVLAGKDRVRNAREAEAASDPDIFVLDDGFQHLKIKRDIDILVISATNPFGNRRLIPAGILREPISHICRSDIIVISKCDLVNKESLLNIKENIHRIKPAAHIFESTHRPVSFTTSDQRILDLKYINGKKTCCVSGIGDNDSFIKTLQKIGADIRLACPYMDHHRYTRPDVDYILTACRDARVDCIATTQKDWLKLEPLIPPYSETEVIVLNMRFVVYDEEKFFRRLHNILSG